MKFWKMNGAGNAFAIFDARSAPFAPTPEQIRKIADDLKADQIIAMERDATKDVFMRIWNADGTEVSACGNATRCVGLLMLEETGKDRVTIQTEADMLKAFRAEDGLITVDMGAPLLGWEDIPLSEKMDVRGVDVKIGPIDAPILARPAVVSMGNPHAVFWVDDPYAYDLEKFGPLLENHPIFPERANISLAAVKDREHIIMRTWERGAGLTRACGSAACAVAVSAARTKRTGRKVHLSLPGGNLFIEWRESDDHVLMTGPAAFEFEGVLDAKILNTASAA